MSHQARRCASAPDFSFSRFPRSESSLRRPRRDLPDALVWIFRLALAFIDPRVLLLPLVDS
jgi:hypothetical protein